MAATVSDTSTNAALSQWLRLLWDLSPPLRFGSEAPFISGGAIHLPAHSQWRSHAAAAAHAAAHLVYSPKRFDGTGLAPIARALMALLEDARVEALAMRELPGLARIWGPLHTASPELGGDFDALMQRLARALADPGYDDPDSWVRKGRTLFYLDANLGLLALRTPAEVRKAATLLGHDIGQMRLQFNAKTYRPMPTYRDDHRWMWDADVASEAPPPPTTTSSTSSGVVDEHEPVTEANVSVSHYPEWDRLISRVRPNWCRVVEYEYEYDHKPGLMDGKSTTAGDRDLRLACNPRLRRVLETSMRSSRAPRRSEEGETFDLSALVELRVAQRTRQAADARLHRQLEYINRRGAVTLLIDQSTSTADRHGPNGGSTILQAASSSAVAMAAALNVVGVPCSVAAFESSGRNKVTWRIMKRFDAPTNRLLVSRLAALRPRGSTRLGAAIRHGVQRLAERPPGSHWLFVLSDGQAHDIDVHDRRYLPADAQHAVRSAHRHNVQVACLVIGGGQGTALRWIFGGRRVGLLRGAEHLPNLLERIVA